MVENYHFYIGERKNTIQLSFDILNRPNLISSNWGAYKSTTLNTSYSMTKVLNYEGVTENNVPQYSLMTIVKDGKTVLPTETFQSTRSQSSTWSMQIGVRYIF